MTVQQCGSASTDNDTTANSELKSFPLIVYTPHDPSNLTFSNSNHVTLLLKRTQDLSSYKLKSNSNYKLEYEDEQHSKTPQRHDESHILSHASNQFYRPKAGGIAADRSIIPLNRKLSFFR